MRRVVVIESPYAGNVELNLAYARAAMRHCILGGETPIASHLLYPQKGVLDDLDPKERELGIAMGFQFWELADCICFYVDLGWSRGMLAARSRFLENLPADGVLDMEERTVPGWREAAERTG